MRFLPRVLRKGVRTGRLNMTGPNGYSESFGPGGELPDVNIEIKDPALDWKIFLRPELATAEAFMDGRLTVEGGESYPLIELAQKNAWLLDSDFPLQDYERRLRKAANRFLKNPVTAARRNAQHHYDIGNAFYRLWLDADMQYSCGYFPEGGETIDEAQTAKKRHIAAKLDLKPGQQVLDIGCGWGGLALYLASVEEVEVTGITLAPEQLKIARARADAMGLSNRVRFELEDYREHTPTYDRIVSVGMLEHVGKASLGTYFRNVRDRLSPDGLAMIHSISTALSSSDPGPFFSKYIFPGSYAPTVPESTREIADAGLWLQDLEIWRVHYAETLRHWRERFRDVRDQVEEMYDERFARMWEFYLAGAECSFRYGISNVYQALIGHKRDAAPLSRDYITEREAVYREREPEFIPKIMEATEKAFAAS